MNGGNGDGGASAAMIGRIRSRLLTCRDVVCGKITDYPTPVADDDDVFNGLLAERDRIFDELRALAAMEEGGGEAAVLLAFVRESRCLEPGDRAIFETVIAGSA